jgi:hypothetical protein
LWLTDHSIENACLPCYVAIWEAELTTATRVVFQLDVVASTHIKFVVRLTLFFEVLHTLSDLGKGSVNAVALGVIGDTLPLGEFGGSAKIRSRPVQQNCPSAVMNFQVQNKHMPLDQCNCMQPFGDKRLYTSTETLL